MNEWQSVRIVLEAFDAVEQRDEPRLKPPVNTVSRSDEPAG
jgi:hypothetical protein